MFLKTVNNLRNNILKSFPIILLFIVSALAPPFMGTYYSSLLMKVLYWMALAVSWDFFSGLTKYVSLGSAAFFGIGVYITAVFGKIYPFSVVVLLAGIISFIFAICIGVVTLRLKGIYFAIFTFGLGELLNNAILFWEMNVTGTRGRWVISIDVYYPILIITMISILIITLLRLSKLGLALTLIGESEEAAIHLGVNTTLYKILGFATASMFISFVGATLAPRWGYIDSGVAFNSLYSFMPAIMALFGGAGAPYGPILGAVLLSLMEEYLLTAFRDYFMIILGLVLIVIILFLPNGLIGIFEMLKSKRAKKFDPVFK